MKKNIRVFENGKYIDKEINYIPIRYIIAIILAIFEISSIIAILVLLAMYVPYFYIAIYITVVVIEIKIIASDENPDYKVPWLIAVIALPIIGMMLYFMFSKRKLLKKIINKLAIYNNPIIYDKHNKNLNRLKDQNELLYTQALNNPDDAVLAERLSAVTAEFENLDKMKAVGRVNIAEEGVRTSGHLPLNMLPYLYQQKAA